jgi:predicted DNA-binding transcriptional regulator AlpA
MHPQTPEQRHFDQKYITATEIADTLGVSRPAVHYARKRGILPNPILVGPDMIFIWERAAVTPAINAWKEKLVVKKGVPA